MEYYGFTVEQYNKAIILLNTISVTGINQIDAFHDAVDILRKAVSIDIKQEEVKKDGN